MEMPNVLGEDLVLLDLTFEDDKLAIWKIHLF